MAMQQTNSSFAARLGARVVQANAEHKDKPIDTGNRRLPGGIKSGVAKLQFMYTKEQDKDDGVCPKGEVFLRASGMVIGQVINGVLVKEHNGFGIEGLTTAKVIPLCDIPEKVYDGGGKREARSLSMNWFEFQNLFKLLSNGSIVCHETEQNKIESFYFAAMAALTNPKHPIYVDFSTEDFKSKKRFNETDAQYAAREPFVIEKWHGLAQLPASANGQHDPAAGMTQSPRPNDPPPAPPKSNGAAPPANNQPQPSAPTVVLGDEAEVAGLVEVAMLDPNCETPDGSAATTQLEEMAWARGWSKDQTKNAKDWVQVGEMALAGPTAASQIPNQSSATTPTVGARFMYAKRTKDGIKYKDNKGAEFPAQECEVTGVNEQAKTVTLKTVHDGKDVVDIRTKKQVDVKFEWLESAPAY